MLEVAGRSVTSCVPNSEQRHFRYTDTSPCGISLQTGEASAIGAILEGPHLPIRIDDARRVSSKEVVASKLLRIKGLSPVLRNMSDDDIGILASGAQIKSFRRGQVAFEQASRATDFAIILEGVLKSSSVTPSGHELLLTVFGPGETVGWQALIGDKEYTFSASGFREMSLAIWKGAELRATLAKHPAMAFQFFEALLDRADSFIEHTRHLMTSSAEQRLGYVVAQLAGRFGEACAVGIRLRGFTGEDLAAMTGLNRFTVTRLLKKWRQKHWIDVRRRDLLIKNLEEVAAIRDESAAAG